MTTSITTRTGKGSPLTHSEVDANFNNLKTTADAAAADASQAQTTKANASAIGIAAEAADMGTFTGTTITDNATAKDALQELETAVESVSGSAATKANASAVGISASASNMGTYTGSTLPDNETAKQNLQTLETAVEARPTSATLAASGGSALVGFLQAGTGAVARTMQSKERDVVSLRDFGAVGDGTTDDTAALTTAIAAAISLAKPLFVPAGTYKVTSSVSLPNNLTMLGEDPLRSIVQASATTFPVFINTTTTTPKDVTFKGLQIKSGSYGIDLTASSAQSNWQFEDVLFLDCLTAGIRCNQMFILNSFTRTIFDSTNKGIICSAANANLNTFYDCEFKELANSAIELLGGSEANTWIGCRFEARSQASDAGNNTIVIANGKCNKFLGCYFEDVFKSILSETSSTNTTEFNSCRFSGQENTGGGLQAETFTSNGIVNFANCQFAVTGGSTGATNMLLLRHNPGLLTHNSNIYNQNDDSRIRVRSKVISVTASGSAEDVFTFTRSDVTSNADNIQALGGTITTVVQGQTAGGTPFHSTITQPITITGFANSTMSATIGATGLAQATYDPSATGATISMGQKAGATNASVTVSSTFTLAGFGSAQMTAILDVTPVRFSTAWPHIAVSPVAA